jgi:radical S-adenosyl methionine domain-containing protein 2
MVAKVRELAPCRWKVFQVLMVQDENDSDETLRNMNKFRITDEFDVFCNKHRHVKHFILEENSIMASSYLLVDESICFMDKGIGPMKLSDSILDVGVMKALSQVRWDYTAFKKRGGIYKWSKSAVTSMNTEGAAIAQEMGAGATKSSCGASKQLPEW